MSKYRKTQYLAPKSELTEQIRVMQWCKSMEAYDKDYSLIYHVPNEGNRNRKTGSNLVKAGLKKGVPDICVAVPKMGMHGLYIELKKDKQSKVSKEQIEWIKKLSHQKYIATVCYGADEAINLIASYMSSNISDLKVQNIKDFKKEFKDENIKGQIDVEEALQNIESENKKISNLDKIKTFDTIYMSEFMFRMINRQCKICPIGSKGKCIFYNTEEVTDRLCKKQIRIWLETENMLEAEFPG